MIWPKNSFEVKLWFVLCTLLSLRHSTPLHTIKCVLGTEMCTLYSVCECECRCTLACRCVLIPAEQRDGCDRLWQARHGGSRLSCQTNRQTKETRDKENKDKGGRWEESDRLTAENMNERHNSGIITYPSLTPHFPHSVRSSFNARPSHGPVVKSHHLVVLQRQI